MKRIMLGAAMLLLACSLTARATDKREPTYVAGADVDANGHISATQVDPEVPASIAAVLAVAVKQWKFVPARLNGQPVPAHTFIRAELQALPKASGQYNLRVSFMGNGPRMGKLRPLYPAAALRRRQSAFMILDATVQPDGHLTDMTASSKFAKWHVLPSFKDAVLTAAKHWHFIPEQVDGRPVATHMRIPVTFNYDRHFTHEQIKILHEAARKEAATADTETAPPAIPLPSDQAVALDSPLQPRAVATITHAP